MTRGFSFGLKIVARRYSRPMLLDWRAVLLRRVARGREHGRTSRSILVALSRGRATAGECSENSHQEGPGTEQATPTKHIIRPVRVGAQAVTMVKAAHNDPKSLHQPWRKTARQYLTPQTCQNMLELMLISCSFVT
jgi:hypothetical protein